MYKYMMVFCCLLVKLLCNLYLQFQRKKCHKNGNNHSLPFNFRIPYPVIRPSWPRPLYSNYFKTNSSYCLPDTPHDTHLTLGVQISQGNFAYSSRISFGIVCCHCLAKKAITKQNRLREYMAWYFSWKPNFSWLAEWGDGTERVCFPQK